MEEGVARGRQEGGGRLLLLSTGSSLHFDLAFSIGIAIGVMLRST